MNNQARYTIQLVDTFHGLILAEACRSLEMGLAHQLQEETARRKKWGGLFYKPSPGINTIDRMAVEIQAIRGAILTKMDNCAGELVVNQTSANLLILALAPIKQRLQREEKPDPGLVEVIDSFMNQLPFNTTTTDKAIFWGDVHPNK